MAVFYKYEYRNKRKNIHPCLQQSMLFPPTCAAIAAAASATFFISLLFLISLNSAPVISELLVLMPGLLLLLLRPLLRLLLLKKYWHALFSFVTDLCFEFDSIFTWILYLCSCFFSPCFCSYSFPCSSLDSCSYLCLPSLSLMVVPPGSSHQSTETWVIKFTYDMISFYL